MKNYPFQINDKNIRQVIDVCTMYYENKLSEREISSRLNISRSQVSKILLAAKEQKIVTINISNPFSKETELEKNLVKKFNLESALVLSDDNNYSSTSSSALTSFVSAKIKDHDIIGITPGNSVNDLCNKIGYIHRNYLTIVSLVGGGSIGDPSWQANQTANLLSQKWACDCASFNAPGFVQSPDTKANLLNEPSIQNVLAIIDNTTVAFLGIGSFTENSTFVQTHYLTESDLSELSTKKAIGGVCNFFYDAKGDLIDFSGYNRMIGVPPICVKSIPTRIGIGIGSDKLASINAALNGKWINSLITDVKTASLLIR